MRFIRVSRRACGLDRPGRSSCKGGSRADGTQALTISPDCASIVSHGWSSEIDRTDAIRFALDHSTVKGCEPLVSRVVERTIAVLHGGGKGRDDFSVLVRIQQQQKKKGVGFCLLYVFIVRVYLGC